MGHIAQMRSISLQQTSYRKSTIIPTLWLLKRTFKSNHSEWISAYHISSLWKEWHFICQKKRKKRERNETKQKQFSSNGERIKILKVVNIFHYFLMISPWRMVRPFVGTNLNFPYNGRLCAKFGWYFPIVLKIFKSSRKCIFSMYFAITSHLMRTWPIGTNLNPLHSRTLRAKFG